MLPAVGHAQDDLEDERARGWAESKSLYALKLAIAEIQPDGKIIVKISNVSRRPLRIFEEWNSWGAAHWRVLRVRGGQVESFFQQVHWAWTLNDPTFVEIPSGADVERKLDLNAKAGISVWRGLGGKKVRFEPGDMVIVLYEVPVSGEAIDLGWGLAGPPAQEYRGRDVWYGVAAAYAAVR